MVESGEIFDWMVESGGIDWMVESWWNLRRLKVEFSEFGGIWWNLVESGILVESTEWWNLVEFLKSDWMVESGEIFDWMVESGGIDWMVESCGTWWNLQILVESTEWWNLVEYLTEWWNLVESTEWWNLGILTWVESTNFGGIDWMVESGGIFDWMVESGGIDWMVESGGI